LQATAETDSDPEDDSEDDYKDCFEDKDEDEDELCITLSATPARKPLVPNLPAFRQQDARWVDDGSLTRRSPRDILNIIVMNACKRD
jgi:hypothetical protein